MAFGHMQAHFCPFLKFRKLFCSAQALSLMHVSRGQCRYTGGLLGPVQQTDPFAQVFRFFETQC